MHILNNRFLAAIRLCSGHHDIKQRLTMAWSEHLDPIDPEELPAPLRNDFIKLRKAMYARAPLTFAFESAPEASVRKMSANDAADQIRLIIAIFSDLQRIDAAKGAQKSTQDATHDNLSTEKNNNHPQLN